MSKPDHDYHEVRRKNTLIFLFFYCHENMILFMLSFGAVFICLQKGNYHNYFGCKMGIAFYNKVKVKLIDAFN